MFCFVCVCVEGQEMVLWRSVLFLCEGIKGVIKLN